MSIPTRLGLTACLGLFFALPTYAADITPLMQGALRSGVAVVLLAAWMRRRGIPIFADGGTLRPGLAVGALFGIEFVCIYLGLQYTNASRMSVFVYLAPPLTALGVHLFVPGERLARRQWIGIVLAFLGIVVAFSDGFLAARRSATCSASSPRSCGQRRRC